MASPIEKVGGMKAALDDLRRRGATSLVNQIAGDWANAGYKYTAKVAADVITVGALNLSDMTAIQAAMADAQAIQIIKLHPDWAGLPTTPSPASQAGKLASGALSSAGNAAQDAANAAVAPLVSSAQFLSALTNPHLWLRVAEVGIGIALLVVGVIKLTPKSVIQGSASVAKVAASL